MKRTLPFLAIAGALLVASCSNTADNAKADPTETATTTTSSDLGEYAASIETSLLQGAGLDTITQACERGIDWICYISEITSTATSVVTVTVQIVESDKEFGNAVARGVYDVASTAHPQLERVQVRNATDDIIADENFT
ncbi:hypothetical protein [Rhodococcus erythropolis]|uniref:hypothetical protein n=1 Tax=Rhodococcus erythropolis TaxID=1833 RepID=UPI0008786554|nr:hypothetical protein [Rhodococcus erythropolis]OFV76944.1 hypothetical protein RERY_23950 [Rhodococcus erythropolis]